jgi:hypothetical protein
MGSSSVKSITSAFLFVLAATAGAARFCADAVIVCSGRVAVDAVNAGTLCVDEGRAGNSRGAAEAVSNIILGAANRGGCRGRAPVALFRTTTAAANNSSSSAILATEPLIIPCAIVLLMASHCAYESLTFFCQLCIQVCFEPVFVRTRSIFTRFFIPCNRCAREIGIEIKSNCGLTRAIRKRKVVFSTERRLTEVTRT